MNILKSADFLREIKTKPSTGYLFFGDEDYLKLHAEKSARENICPDESLAMFNDMKLDALTYSPKALLDMICALPMMAERKLITIKGLDLKNMKNGEIDELISVLSELRDYDYNTLIITVASDKFDAGFLPKRPSSLLTKLSEYLTPVYFEKSTPQKLTSWVYKHYEHNGVNASREVCEFTVDFCGKDMFSLSSETDKISFYVLSQGRNEVFIDDVRNIAVNSSEYDAFAFTNAICANKKDDALEILLEMKKKRADPIIIMSEVSKTISDSVSVFALMNDGLTSGEISKILGIHEYRISIILKSKKPKDPEALLSRALKADMDIKLGMDGYSVLERFICTM